MSSYDVERLSTRKTGTDLSAKTHYIAKAADISGEVGVALAAAATDKLVGVIVEPGSNTADGVVGLASCARGGRCPVIYGGNVTAGDFLTSDASGKAVATVVAGNRIIGIAAKTGVLNDIGEVDLGEGPSVHP
jgi:hypothetical protein